VFDFSLVTANLLQSFCSRRSSGNKSCWHQRKVGRQLCVPWSKSQLGQDTRGCCEQSHGTNEGCQRQLPAWQTHPTCTTHTKFREPKDKRLATRCHTCTAAIRIDLKRQTDTVHPTFDEPNFTTSSFIYMIKLGSQLREQLP
jgi:hypothetical protein